MRFMPKALTLGALITLASLPQIAPTDATVMRPPGGGEHCTYSTSGGYSAYAKCTNNNGHDITFRSNIICGLSPDVDGPWIRLAPGATGTSSASCVSWGTGVGGVSAEIRDA